MYRLPKNCRGDREGLRERIDLPNGMIRTRAKKGISFLALVLIYILNFNKKLIEVVV
jgi:hypothetical protein